MTHTFKYLIKIAFVASALSMTHSPSFAANEEIFKAFCKATKDYKEVSGKYQESWNLIKNLSTTNVTQKAIIDAAKDKDANESSQQVNTIELCKRANLST